MDNLKLKFVYKGNKNVEALNKKTVEDVKNIKAQIVEIKKDASLSDMAKLEKVKKLEDKIESLNKKCKDQTAVWLSEQKEDEKKAKERFNAK